jgi:KaiC/GvpD/RAD55 family RecA-like ATPase
LVAVAKQPVAYTPPDVPFPFDVGFQLKLLKMIMMDGGLVEEAMRHVQPHFFETPELRWVCGKVQDYYKTYGGVPTLDVLRQVSKFDKTQGTLHPVLDQMHAVHLQEEQFIRDQFLDWVRQNIFHQSFREASGLWNNGKRQEAIDHMQLRIEEVQRVHWEKFDDEWLFDNAGTRELAREHAWDDQIKPAIPTGIDGVDQVLDGGLSPGELGIWIAYSGGGKSTLLMNHGAEAARFGKQVAHFILEGSRDLIANRYDAYFSKQAYGLVKKGQMGGKAYAEMMSEYQFMKRRLLLVPLLEKWDYSVLDIDARLKHYKRAFGWKPDMIIVDYGDLLHGRSGPYAAPWMSERDAFRDLKLLSNRGYAVWTASQAQRPTSKNWDITEHLIKTSSIAGGIEKVRVADFVGSINFTLQEKNETKLTRLWCEKYRDAASGKQVIVSMDLATMSFNGQLPEAPQHVHSGPQFKTTGIPLGYVEKPA